MKKLAVLLVVLGFTVVANASLNITVNGVIDPPQVNMAPSDVAIIGIYSNGTSSTGPTYELQISSPGTYDLSNIVNTQNPIYWGLEEQPGLIYLDFSNPISAPPPIPAGQVVDNIKLHGDSAGTITLRMLADGQPIDTQTITVTPEPMTLAFLAFGGLFLRRKQ